MVFKLEKESETVTVATVGLGTLLATTATNNVNVFSSSMLDDDIEGLDPANQVTNKERQTNGRKFLRAQFFTHVGYYTKVHC